MTATDVLRRMLDEHGVEYDTDDEDGCEFTEWVANGLEWEADSRGELVSLMPVMLITPEQAIAATLGRGECHEVMINRHWRGCSECGYVWENMYAAGFQIGPNYCPMCGAKVVDG